MYFFSKKFCHCNSLFWTSFVIFFITLQRNTVSLWTTRWRETGDILRHVTTGRPRISNVQQDRALIENVREDRFVNTSQLATTHNMSQSTVRRRLKEAGLQNRVPAKKPHLTPRHKSLRLQFALNYLDFDFSKVIFIDEKVFCNSTHGRLSLWRYNNTRYSEENILPNNRSGRISLGFWGWISQSGPGELIEVGGRLNGLTYKDILGEVLLPTARIFYPFEEVITFIQDGSSVHNSRVVQDYISENRELNLITLPPKSPDLNPIENVWGRMVQLWDHEQARSTENLRMHVNMIWESLRGRSFCFNTVRSMRQRLLDVINADGGYTRF